LFEDYNSKFQVLATRVDNISDKHLLEAYMGGLKEDIKHEILLKHLENVDEAMNFLIIFKPRIWLPTSLPLGTYVGSRDIFVPHKETLSTHLNIIEGNG
jgi:hypothetical protein